MSTCFTSGDELPAVIAAEGSGAASSVDNCTGQRAPQQGLHMNSGEIIASLIAVLATAGIDADRGAYLLRRAAREVPQALQPPPPKAVVSPLVHGSLWLQVAAGLVDEEEAIDRTRRAALASTEEEAEATLFPVLASAERECGGDDARDRTQ